MTEYKTKLERMIAEENPNNDKISEKVLKELNYSKKQLESDLVHLKEWLKDQHHLPACRLKECDNFLCHYLTGCKGSIEKAKRKLDAYYSLRGKSEVYSNRDPMDEEYKKIWDTSVSITVPKYDENTTECVFINKLLTSEIHPNFLLNTLKIAINMQEAAIRLEAIIRPCIAILDYSNYTPAHAALFSPAVTKDYIYIAQNLFPSRMRKVLFINVPSYLEIIVNTVFKPFITKKLRERFIVTTEGWEIVPQHVNKALIPKDLGGDLKYTVQEIKDAINEYQIVHHDWWINEFNERTDESKRINNDYKYKGDDSQFGVQGTLKKLVID